MSSIISTIGTILFIAAVILWLLHEVFDNSIILWGAFFLCILGGITCKIVSKNVRGPELYEKHFNEGDKEYVIVHLRASKEKEQTKIVKDVFKKFYKDDFDGLYSFISDAGMIEIPFIQDKKGKLNKMILQLYNNADSINTKDSWLAFSNTIGGDFFLKYASDTIKKREFSKWDSDENAWQRVLVMDSVVMSREYLSRFQEGLHEDNARKIILDKEYETLYKKESRPKIVGNYSGKTVISVHNSNTTLIRVSYSGTFAEGHFEVPANGSRSVTVYNGYYRIRASSQDARDREFSSYETFNGGTKNYDLKLVNSHR